MLRLSNIDFGYSKDEPVLKNFNLEVQEGETLAILGSSGCGKSTILRIIAGLESPQKGCIKINNVDFTKVPTNNREIGFVFQEYALFPHMNVEKNIGYGLHKKDSVKVRSTAEMVGIGELLHRYPHELSGGQRQRVALARAICYSPKLLLLDEPFSNLDTKLKDQIRLDLKKILSKTNITTILVTHDEEDANSLADKIVSL